MSNFEFVNFTNYDIKKNHTLIKKIHSNNNNYILYNKFHLRDDKTYTVKDMNFENFIIMDLDELVDDIESSYSNIREIQQQFFIDIKRSYMTFNGRYVKDPYTVINYLESKYRSTDPQLEKEILMLSTQALFAVPFYIIQKSVEKKDLYLSEMSDEDSEQLKIKRKYKIDIMENHIKLEKYMRLFSLAEDPNSTTKYIVKIEIDINLTNDKNFILSFHFI